MIPQDLQREVGAVGQRVDVPLVDAHRDPEIGDVGGVLGGVVGGEVDALGGEAVSASTHGGGALLVVGGALRADADGVGQKLVDLGAGQEWIVLQRAPLA